MKTFKIICERSAVNELQRSSFEMESRRGVVDRYLEKHKDDEDESAINSKPFVYFMKLLCESEANFELAKSEFERNYVPEVLKEHQYSWNLDYNTRELVITLQCDCDVEI